MGRNQTGGYQKNRRNRERTRPINPLELERQPAQLTCYGKITKAYGNGRYDVFCVPPQKDPKIKETPITRNLKLRTKISKPPPVNSYVLVQFFGNKEDIAQDDCQIIYVLSPTDISVLKKLKSWNLPEPQDVPSDNLQQDMQIVWGSDDEEDAPATPAEQKQPLTIVTATIQQLATDDIDIDAI